MITPSNAGGQRTPGLPTVFGARYSATGDTLETFSYQDGTGLKKSSAVSIAAVTGSRAGSLADTFGANPGTSFPFRGEISVPYIRVDELLTDDQITLIAAKLIAGTYA